MHHPGWGHAPGVFSLTGTLPANGAGNVSVSSMSVTGAGCSGGFDNFTMEFSIPDDVCGLPSNARPFSLPSSNARPFSRSIYHLKLLTESVLVSQFGKHRYYLLHERAMPTLVRADLRVNVPMVGRAKNISNSSATFSFTANNITRPHHGYDLGLYSTISTSYARCFWNTSDPWCD